jgi:hypothetical protein
MAKSSGGQQGPTKEERALAQSASKFWDMYQEHFVPMENRYIDRVADLKSPQALAEQRGKVGATTQQSFGDVVHQALMQQKLAGADPSSGRWQETAGGMGQSLGASLSGSYLGVNEALKDAHAGGLMNILAMGSGQQANAQAGLGNVAQMAAQDAQRNAASAFNQRAAQQNLVGTLGGLALGHMGSGGGQQNLTTGQQGMTINTASPTFRDYSGFS